jgi:hypothetical protein
LNRKLAPLLIAVFGCVAIHSTSSDESLSTTGILLRIVEKGKQNEALAENIGFYQVTTDRKLKGEKISDQKIRMYRTIWLENTPYLELMQVNGKEPDEKERKEERKRKEKFIKSLREKPKEDPENITWEDLYSKYDFQPLPADSTGTYVFSFRPKSGKLTERSKIEKVLNHIIGKFWADKDFNIVRAEAKLLDNVKFGFGILGIVEKLEMKYEQNNFEQVLVPSYLYIHYKARVALVKTEERKIEATFTDFFRRHPAPADGGRE